MNPHKGQGSIARQPMRAAIVIATIGSVLAGALLTTGAGAADQTKVSCYKGADPSASAKLKVAPRRCGLVPRSSADGAGADVRRLSWKRWGTSETRGRGIVRLAPGVELKAIVSLSRAQRRSCGRVYTRVRLELGDTSRAAALKSC